MLEGTATFEEVPPTDAMMAQRLKAVLDLGAPWIVAEIDGRVAAYAYATAYKPRAAYRHTAETTIYVSADHQRLGLGRILMTELIARLRAQGVLRLLAVITAESHGSVALHAALGYRPAGQLTRVGRKFGRWLDVSLMQLDLAPDIDAPDGPGLNIA